MKRHLLLAAVSALIPSCASSGSGFSATYSGSVGIVPYRISYSGGKATVSVSAPWRNLRPDNSK